MKIGTFIEQTVIEPRTDVAALGSETTTTSDRHEPAPVAARSAKMLAAASGTRPPCADRAVPVRALAERRSPLPPNPWHAEHRLRLGHL